MLDVLFGCTYIPDPVLIAQHLNYFPKMLVMSVAVPILIVDMLKLSCYANFSWMPKFQIEQLQIFRRVSALQPIMSFQRSTELTPKSGRLISPIDLLDV